jgi:hypothetical protein
MTLRRLTRDANEKIMDVLQRIKHEVSPANVHTLRILTRLALMTG